MAPIFYAVSYAFIFNENWEILLQKRWEECAYMPNKRSVPAWHIEKKEWILNAMKRELNEELWISSDTSNMEVVTNTYFYNAVTDRDYIWYYILVKNFDWEIKNMEPEKCSELKYTKFEDIPYDDMAPEVAFSIKKYLEWVKFNEFYFNW